MYKKINHNYNFVDPTTRVHTQHVESLNNKIKSDIKTQRGVRTLDRPRFLTFLIFIDVFKDEKLAMMIKILKIC